MDAPISRQDKFWSKVTKTISCWTWNGYTNPKGYGKTGWRLAHRVSFEWANGPIPDGALVDHICHNKACVKPSHLRLATPSQNAQNRAGAHVASKSGIRGVYWSEREKGWRADGTINGHRPYLGIYPTKEEAARAIAAWRRANMPYSEMDK